MRVRSSAIAGMYQKSTLSFHPVCGHCLSSRSVLKKWLENEKQEGLKSYTALQWHRILLSWLSLKLSGHVTVVETRDKTEWRHPCMAATKIWHSTQARMQSRATMVALS